MARAAIAEAVEQPVHLFLFVKVREGWGDDPERYREMGLEFPREYRPANPDKSRYILSMQWTDEGIVLGVKRHGETSVILELMTQERGRHLGLVRGGAGTRLRGVLQPGNSLRATWRARLDEHLGHYVVEGINLRAAGFLSDAYAVHGVTHLSALCRLLAEREPHVRIHGSLENILDKIDDPFSTATLIARFEIAFLAELGFGLDLESCAATGSITDLVYVSPRSGRAVSRAAG